MQQNSTVYTLIFPMFSYWLRAKLLNFLQKTKCCNDFVLLKLVSRTKNRTNFPSTMEIF